MKRRDLTLLITPLILVGIGILLLFSLDVHFFKLQLVFLLLAISVYFIFLNVNYTIFNYYSLALYVGMLAVLVISFIIGIEARGAVRWIEVFGIRIQFSEIFKPFFILFFAAFLNRNPSKNLWVFLKGLILFAPLFFLILRQPDLGNALIYLGTLLCMYLLNGFPLRYFVVLFFLIVLPLPYLFTHLASYQKQRVYTFFNTTADPFGSSYNAIQSLISVGNGGFFGKGYGQGSQSTLKFLPEHHTDFMFATLAETFGFVGIMVVFALYVIIFMRILTILNGLSDRFSYLAVGGIYFLILIHVFFNIGMNIAILPIVGITLPFLSYGGSSLITNFILLGIVSSLASESIHKDSVEIR